MFRGVPNQTRRSPTGNGSGVQILDSVGAYEINILNHVKQNSDGSDLNAEMGVSRLSCGPHFPGSPLLPIVILYLHYAAGVQA